MRDLLDKVRRDTNELPEDIYTNDSDAAPNASGLRCIEASMVRVHFGTGNETKRHAAHINEIDFSRNTNSHSNTAKFRAGQSPAAAVAEVGAGMVATAATAATAGLSQACEKALVEGIESGMGVYQFVSRKAHAHPAKSKETPLLAILQQCLALQRPGDPELLLGGRYRVMRFEVQRPEAPDCRHVLLSVQDTMLGVDDTNSCHTIPLTQAGMKFTGKLLDTPEIASASAALDAHRKLIPNEILRTARQAEPTIYSHAGIGRNATLITYRRIAKLIRQNPIPDEKFLAEVLRQTIKTEREFCGKKFLYSEAQINALWLALSANLAEHKAKQLVDGLPHGGVGVAATPENLLTSAGVVPDPNPPPRTAIKSAAIASPIGMVRSSNTTTRTAVPGATAKPGSASTATAISSASVNASSASTATFIPSSTIKPGNESTATVILSKSFKSGHASTATGIPDMAIPRVRQTFQAVVTDPFEGLERTDNHYHANWLAGVELIRQHDLAKAQRFKQAFEVQRYLDPDSKPGDPEPKGLLKHLSDRQLAAIEKHLTDPEDLQNKPQPKPETEAEQAANRKAIELAQSGTDVDSGRSSRAADAVSTAFDEQNFTVLANRGEGDCLFHALCGRPAQGSLSKEQVAEIRHQTALVRLRRPDTEAEMRSNWHDLYGAIPHPDFINISFSENGIPLELSNAQVGFCQQRPGYVGGDLEIADWVAILGNKTEAVVIIDGQIGIESIVKFTRQDGRVANLLRNRENFSTMKADNVRQWIENELGDALNDAEMIYSNETPRVVAIYRSPGHFERIIGLNTWERKTSPSFLNQPLSGLFK